MLPQQFSTDFYANSPQFVNQDYPEQFPAHPEPGPSASTPHSQYSSSRDDSSTVPKRPAQRTRRKRVSDPTHDNPDNSPDSGSGPVPGSQRTAPKKKKANRACFHCQKAHLTCDDSRPCQRCIKRGLADKCTEGLRKKAKYLLDEDELAALKQQQQQQKSRERTDPASVPAVASPLPHQPLNPPQPVPQDPHPDPLFNLAFDQAYSFGSEAANLEYSILSAILGNPSPPDDRSNLNSHDATNGVNGAYPQFANPDWPAPPPPHIAPRSSPTISPSFLQQQSAYGEAPSFPTQPPPQSQPFNTLPSFNQLPTSTPSGAQTADHAIHQPHAQIQYSPPSWNTSNPGATAAAEATTSVEPGTSYLRTSAPGRPQGTPYPTPTESQLQVVPPSNSHSLGKNHVQANNQSKSLAPLSPPPSNSSPGTPLADGGSLQFHLDGQAAQSGQRSSHPRNPQQHQTPTWGFAGGSSETGAARGFASTSGGSTISNDARGANDPSSVYNAVMKRYDYTQGYHYLMKHLHMRFEKNDILRVVRALAIVRPSLIALQMPLTEEDEVFVEKCFQRSLIEMDKLISFGGTPTVVWRRTGEICLVGIEFTMLTEWTREELLGRRKYIYELFENQSTVEYFEKFAAHAFENTTQSVFSHCVLLKPSGAPVPCTFCFSIRRDIFDLPNMIIGQWLPLL